MNNLEIIFIYMFVNRVFKSFFERTFYTVAKKKEYVKIK